MKKTVVWLAFCLAVSACGEDEKAEYTGDQIATRGEMEKAGVGITCASAAIRDRDGLDKKGNNAMGAALGACDGRDNTKEFVLPSWTTDLGTIHVGPPGSKNRMEFGLASAMQIANPTKKTSRYILEVESDFDCWNSLDDPFQPHVMGLTGTGWGDGDTCQTEYSLGKKQIAWRLFYPDATFVNRKPSRADMFGEFVITLNIVE